jgi:hypothetical protein
VPGGFGGSVNKLKLRREFSDGVELAGVVAHGLCVYVLVKDIGRVVLPGLTTICYGSRDRSKIMRRTISGSAREIFPRIRWTGERCTSSSRSDNDRVLLRGATTGVLDSSLTLAFVLIVVRRYKHPENINPAYPERPGILENSLYVISFSPPPPPSYIP